MRPETEAKIMIALLISLIAFGCGSCLGIILGLSPANTTPNLTLNNTMQIPLEGVTNQTQVNQTGTPPENRNNSSN